MDDFDLLDLITCEINLDTVPLDELSGFKVIQVTEPIQVSRDEKEKTRLRKHRESMARLRHKRREGIQRLEHKEQRLNRKLQKVLQWATQRPEAHVFSTGDELRYANLVLQSEALRVEGYALEQELYRHRLYRNVVAGDLSRLDAAARRDVSEQKQNPTNSCAPRSIGVRSVVPLDYEPITRDMCIDAINQGLTFGSATRDLLRESQTQVSFCLGWRVERLLATSDGDVTTHFCCSRHVLHHAVTLEGIQDETWTMLQSPEHMQHIIGGMLRTQHAQRVSNDADVWLCSSAFCDGRDEFQFYVLTTRMQAMDSQSRVILMLILDHHPKEGLHEELHRDEMDPVDWLRHGGVRLQFTASDEGEIQVECVGAIPWRRQDHVADRMIDVCAALVRWGQEVLPPLFLFGPSPVPNL